MGSGEVNILKAIAQLRDLLGKSPEKILTTIALVRAELDVLENDAKDQIDNPPAKPKREPIDGMPLGKVQRMGPTGFHKPRS